MGGWHTLWSPSHLERLWISADFYSIFKEAGTAQISLAHVFLFLLDKVASWIGMPAQISELDIMDEDQLIEEVLDKFVNCHEQTYEEFLSTFTHLSKGKMK